jgi:hypothetical protein
MPHLERDDERAEWKMEPGRGKAVQDWAGTLKGCEGSAGSRWRYWGLADLGGPDQWQKCLTHKAHMRSGEKGRVEGQKQLEVGAATKGTL